MIMIINIIIVIMIINFICLG